MAELLVVPSWVSTPPAVRPYTLKNRETLFTSMKLAAAAKMFMSQRPDGMKGETPNEEMGQAKSVRFVVPVRFVEFTVTTAFRFELIDSCA